MGPVAKIENLFYTFTSAQFKCEDITSLCIWPNKKIRANKSTINWQCLTRMSESIASCFWCWRFRHGSTLWQLILARLHQHKERVWQKWIFARKCPVSDNLSTIYLATQLSLVHAQCANALVETISQLMVGSCVIPFPVPEGSPPCIWKE